MKRKLTLSGNDLKCIAVLAMTVDHIAFLFAEPDTPVYFIMRLIGRLTAPIMSFFIAEGFCYTKNYRKYLMRMLLFAVITQPFYFLMIFGRPPKNVAEFFMHMNVMVTLSISLLVLKIVSGKIPMEKKIILTAICFALADLCDWSYVIPAWVLVFFLFRNEKRKRTLLFIGVSVLLLVQRYLPLYDSFADFSYQLGVLLAVIPLSLYNGKRDSRISSWSGSRWLFYIYYPLHICVLVVVRFAKS